MVAPRGARVKPLGLKSFLGLAGSDASENSHDLAEDLDLVGLDRLVGGVLREEANPSPATLEPLDRRLVLAGERRHDLAVFGLGLLADDHGVAVEDPGPGHRVAGH